MASAGIKIIELGKELNVDPRQIVAAAKEMAMENAKVPASWVTFGQAERLRAKFGGQKHLKAALERIQRAKEESAHPTPIDTQADAAARTPKLGKKNFETDRRKIFGVVATPGGVRVDKREPEKTHAKHSKAETSASHAEPPVPPSDTKPAEPASSNDVAPDPVAAPPKKVLEIKVAPPIRRESAKGDPRFGVVVPAPEAAAPERSEQKESVLWGKLNDGREQPQFAAPESSAQKQEEADDKPQISTMDPEELEMIPDPKTVIPTAQEEVEDEPLAAFVEEVELPVKSARAEKAAEAPEADYTPSRRTVEHVPVKRQPEHKAFGAKHKLKAKHHKKLKAAETHKPKRAHKEKPEPKHTAPATHAHAPAEKPSTHGKTAPQKPGLLQRLVRKLFKK